LLDSDFRHRLKSPSVFCVGYEATTDPKTGKREMDVVSTICHWHHHLDAWYTSIHNAWFTSVDIL